MSVNFLALTSFCFVFFFQRGDLPEPFDTSCTPYSFLILTESVVALNVRGCNDDTIFIAHRERTQM